MGSIASMVLAMGYRIGGAGAGQCQHCQHRDPRLTGLRCLRGGFWVQPNAGCKEFSAQPDAPAPAPDTRICIGPTDV